MTQPMMSRESSRGIFGLGRVPFQLINNTGYNTSDLGRFVTAGLKALGAQGSKTIAFVSAPQRSRGCAEVGSSKKQSGEEDQVVIALSPPHRFSMRRLARLFQHEIMHSRGFSHDEMNDNELMSLGPLPDWARNLRIRYEGRAPNQMP